MNILELFYNTRNVILSKENYESVWRCNTHAEPDSGQRPKDDFLSQSWRAIATHYLLYLPVTQGISFAK